MYFCSRPGSVDGNNEDCVTGTVAGGSYVTPVGRGMGMEVGIEEGHAGLRFVGLQKASP